MTSQERPVEERNEENTPLENGIVAVEEQTVSSPSNQEEQAATAPTNAASSETDVERATSAPVETDEQNAAERAIGETLATETPAEAVESSSEETAASATESSSDDSAITTAPVADDASDTSSVDAENVAPATETPAADDASTTPSVDAEHVATVAEPAPKTATTDAASAAPAVDTGDAEGASFTPVAEEDTGKPRRVKDLEAGMELDGRVTSIALYGIFVDIGVGRDGLVHISEMSNTRIDSPSDVVQIGDTVKVRVKSVEPDGRRISLTMRTQDREGARSRGRKKPDINRDALSSMRVGDTLEGTVTGIAPFGVFVDIGVGKDGLVHISELSEGRIDKAEDAVQVGQSYTFKILEVDAEGTRISLSLRRAQRAQRLQELERGQIMDGTVSGLAPFGAFVDIGVGRDGLVHISELSEGRVDKVEDAVKVGDKVQVRVLEIDPQSKRISLSMVLEERAQQEPQEQSGQQSGRSARFEDRISRQEQSPRTPRAPRTETPANTRTEVYSSADDEEPEVTGNATLDDLLSKYGNGGRREKRRRQEGEEEVEDNSRGGRRQRDVIRRTLQQLGDDE